VRNKLLGSRGGVGDAFIGILLVIIIFAGLLGMVYLIKDNHKVGAKDFSVTEQDLERIKSSMRVIKKDGKCYSVVVSYTYYGYPVVSHTLIPCD
jgi:hypothetical protein